MSARVVIAIVAFAVAEIAMIAVYQLIGVMSDEMNRISYPAAPFVELPRIEQIPLFMRHYRRLYPDGRRLVYLRAAIAMHLGGFLIAGIFLVTEGP
jgi:hypothetical protein